MPTCCAKPGFLPLTGEPRSGRCWRSAWRNWCASEGRMADCGHGLSLDCVRGWTCIGSLRIPATNCTSASPRRIAHGEEEAFSRTHGRHGGDEGAAGGEDHVAKLQSKSGTLAESGFEA